MKLIQRCIAVYILVPFLSTTLMPVARAGMVQMPAPGTMVNLTPAFTPAHLMGIVIDPKNALKFDFLIHKGEVPLSDTQKREEYRDLIKYFLASLTIPNDNQWVNLSPYEGQRMIRDDFGKTGMGRDLLAQDYILKQLTASLMHPDSELGKKFWARVYEQVYQKYGTTEVPVDTFNKVWVTADDASVYEKDNTAIVVNSHLKIMTERDYVATANDALTREMGQAPAMTEPSKISAEIVKEIIIPAIEKEVNEGQTFANLRQIYSSMILAVWFKKQLRESILGKAYVDHSAVKGVDQDPKNNEVIYQKYLEAYKKGVFNMIKEDEDRYTHEVVPRKYFSGGTKVAQVHDAAAADAKKVVLPALQDNSVEMVDAAFTTETSDDYAAQQENTKGSKQVRTIGDARRLLESLGVTPEMSFTYRSDDYQEAYQEKTVTLNIMSLMEALKWIKSIQELARWNEVSSKNKALLNKAKEQLKKEFNIKGGERFSFIQNDYQEPRYGTMISVAFENLNLAQAIAWIEHLGGKFRRDLSTAANEEKPDGAMKSEIEQKALRAARDLILTYGGKPDYKGTSQKEAIAQLVAASGYKGKDANLFSKTVENVLSVERLISNEAAVEFVKTGVKAQANWVGDKMKGLTSKVLSKFFETSLWPLAEILRKDNFYQNFNEATWKAFQEFKNGNSDVEGLSAGAGVNRKVFQLLAAVDAMVQSIKAELNQNFSLEERMTLAKLVHNNGYFLAEFARTRDPHDQLLPVEKNGSLKGNGADLLTPAARARYDARVGVTGRDSLVKLSLGDFVLTTTEDRSKVLSYFSEMGKDVKSPMKNIDPKDDGIGISLEEAIGSGDEALLNSKNVFNGFVQNWDGLLADFKGNEELYAKQEAFIYGKQVDAVASTLVLLSLEKLFKQYLDAQVDASKEAEFLDIMNRATNAVWRATNPWESWSSPLIRQSYDEIGLDQKMKDERIWKAVILEFRVKLFRMSAAAQKDLSTQIRTLFKFLKSARSPIVKRQVINKTPEAYYNLMKKNGYIFVGTVTSSGLGISQKDIAPAKAAIKKTLQNIAHTAGVSMNKIVLVSGATGNEEAGNLSGVELSYQAAEEVGAMTMGITSTKAFSYPIKTPDFLLFKGMDWGNESDMLLMYADHMIGFTGGNQAASEMEQYINAQRGPVYLIQGVHSYLPNLKKTGSTTGTLDAPEVEMMVRGMGVEGSSVININAQPDGAMKIEIKQKALAAVKRYIQHNGGRPDRGDPSGDQVVAILVQQSRLTGQDLKDFRSMVDEFLNAQPVNTSHGLGYDYVLSTAGQVFQNRLFRAEEERKSVDVIEEEDNKAAITIINELKGDTFDVRISGDETALATAAERDFKQIVSLQIFRGTKSTEQAFVVGLAVRKALHYSEQLRQGDTVIYEFTADAAENKKVQVKKDIYGGIDFNEQYLKMNIKRDGNGVPLPIGQQNLDKIKIDGLVPVILNIQPVTSLPILSKASALDPAMG